MGIYRLMPRLRACLGSDARLSDGIRAVNFLTVKDGGETVITLFYDAPLSDEWRVSARTLIVSLGSDLGRLSVQGRSKGKCILEGSDSVTERLLPCQESGVVMYRQVEGSFSNPNPAVNEKVLQWLVDCAKLIRSWERLQEQGQGGREASGSGDVLLELYSGNGNHTCVLAKFFRRVVAVEINPVLCQAAEHNLRLNGLENARVFCSPSATVCAVICWLYQEPRMCARMKTRTDCTSCQVRAFAPASSARSAWLHHPHPLGQGWICLHQRQIWRTLTQCSWTLHGRGWMPRRGGRWRRTHTSCTSHAAPTR